MAQAMGQIRGSSQTLPVRPGNLLPSAPNPAPFRAVLSRMPYLSIQRDAATGWPLLLFPLPLPIRAQAARSEAERAEREAGHIRPAPLDLERRVKCGCREPQAPVFGALGSGLRGLQRVSEKTKRFLFHRSGGGFSLARQRKAGAGINHREMPLQKRRSLTAPPKVYFVLG